MIPGYAITGQKQRASCSGSDFDWEGGRSQIFGRYGFSYFLVLGICSEIAFNFALVGA